IVEERNGDHRRGPGDNQGVYVWRSSANTAAASWPTFQQNAARTGTIRTDPSVFSGYVDAAYQTLLGRPADAPGRLYWSTLLANGMPRGEFALALARTPEWVNTVIAGQYQQILGRSPDGPGLAYWSQHVR